MICICKSLAGALETANSSASSRAGLETGWRAENNMTLMTEFVVLHVVLLSALQPTSCSCFLLAFADSTETDRHSRQGQSVIRDQRGHLHDGWQICTLQISESTDRRGSVYIGGSLYTWMLSLH